MLEEVARQAARRVERFGKDAQYADIAEKVALAAATAQAYDAAPLRGNARIRLGETVAAYCLSLAGCWDRVAFDAELACAFGSQLGKGSGSVGEKLYSQMHKAMRGLTAGRLGAFPPSANRQRKRRPRREYAAVAAASDATPPGAQPEAEPAAHGQRLGSPPLPAPLSEEEDAEECAGLTCSRSGTRLPQSFPSCPLAASAKCVQLHALGNALCRKVAGGAEEAAICDCGEDMRLRAQEIEWEQLNDEAGAQLVGAIMDVLTEAIEKFQASWRVRDICVSVLLELCRNPFHVFGLQLVPALGGSGKTRILELSQASRERLLRALTTGGAVDEHGELYELLVRTQSLSKLHLLLGCGAVLLPTVSPRLSPALRRVLAESSYGLSWCLAQCVAHCQYENTDARAEADVQEATLFLRRVMDEAKIWHATPSQCEGSVCEGWVLDVPSYTQQKLAERFLFATLLFDVERAILQPLADFGDTISETVLLAMCNALRARHALQPLPAQTTENVSSFLLGMDRCSVYPRSLWSRNLGCRLEYLWTVAELIPDLVCKVSPPSDLGLLAVEEALKAVEEAGCSHAKKLKDWQAPTLNVVLWVLGKFFEGASSFGPRGFSIKKLCTRVAKDFPGLEGMGPNSSVTGALREARALLASPASLSA